MMAGHHGYSRMIRLFSDQLDALDIGYETVIYPRLKFQFFLLTLLWYCDLFSLRRGAMVMVSRVSIKWFATIPLMERL
jgi:hypothetical protein